VSLADTLAVARNELARSLLLAGVVAGGVALRAGERWRIHAYRRHQAELRRRYGITPDTPVRPWGDEVAAGIAAWAETQPAVRWAATSGSTAKPKRVAFTPARLRRIKLGSFSVAARMVSGHPGWRMGLFIMAGLKQDDSLTALLLDGQGRRPPWPVGLLMPARWLADPDVSALVDGYGATAVRLWLLVLADPGVLYATNPSTLAVFLAELHGGGWREHARLCREFVADPGRFSAGVRRAARQVASPGWRARLARAGAADAVPPVEDLLPGLEAWCSWDGGYVRPFLEQVRAYLPPERYLFVPMYSMSTETVETLNHFEADGRVRLLALAPGVLYEFLPEGADDRPELLIEPWALAPGRAYTLVVSDAYGLRRYQTEDLFLCRGHVGDVPDLAFLRRRGLTWSFTGEKLTDQHLEAAYEALRAEVPALRAAGVQLTLVPSRPEGALLPGYVLVAAHPGRERPPLPDDLAARFDRLLAAQNGELAAKHESRRLAPTRVVVCRYDALAAALDPKTQASGDTGRRVWDTQFKLLPLIRRTWEEQGLGRTLGG
jgi:hypothetical protein